MLKEFRERRDMFGTVGEENYFRSSILDKLEGERCEHETLTFRSASELILAEVVANILWLLKYL